MADPTAWAVVEAGGTARRPRGRATATAAAERTPTFWPDLP
jgi:hypothetical protein